MRKLGRIRCVNCKEQGRERTFATPSGYQSHLERYHHAKPDDQVRIKNGND